MKVIYGIGKDKSAFKNVVLVVGIFDGVHVGHQELIRRAVKRAKAIHGRVFILTFFPHPVQVLHPEECFSWVISLPLRLKFFEQLGVFGCIVIKFTRQFSRLIPEQFIRKYLINHIRPREIFVGEDFRFGQNRAGTIDYFKKAGNRYGFKVNAVRSVARQKSKKISSTTIRALIARGKLKEASSLLGRGVAMMGKVERGDGRGKILGFPTANIYPGREVLPPIGVYAARVRIGEKIFGGMANIGVRPSFKSKKRRMNVEVHIFNFNQNLYGREIIVEFVKNIRREKYFPSKEKLIVQLKKDERKARIILKKFR